MICSEPVTIDLELSGATLQVQTDSLVVYFCERHESLGRRGPAI